MRNDLRAVFPEVLKIESLRPLTPSDIDLDFIRRKLKEGGLRTELSKAARESLSHKTFLTFHDPEGRGPGVAEFIGKNRIVPLLEKTYELMDPRRKLKKGNEKSAARGMRHWVADLALLVTDPEPSDEKIADFCLKTNQRVKSGYPRGEYPTSFVDIPNPPKTIASVPPDSIPKLWNFLTTPLNK